MGDLTEAQVRALWKAFYDDNFYKHFAGQPFERGDFGKECFIAGIAALALHRKESK